MAFTCTYLHENIYQNDKNPHIQAYGFNILMEITLVPTCCSEKEEHWYSFYTSDLCFIL